MAKEYIEREAVLKAYLDLALAKSKAAKARKGAAVFQGDLFPMVELTEKEWVRLINAAPAADVVEVVRCRDCVNGGQCSVEDAFRRIAGLKNPYCCVGKRKNGR